MDKINLLMETLQKKSDAEKKAWWENYMRDEIEFIGVPMNVIRDTVVNHFYHEEDMLEMAFKLFKLPIAEAKLAAILLIENGIHKLKGTEVVLMLRDVFEHGYIYDWNTCDWLCVKVIAKLIQRDQEQVIELLRTWINEPNLWQRRASLVGFVRLPHLEDYDEFTFTIADQLVKFPERFAKTAVGWFLRERSKTNGHDVVDFLEEHSVYITSEVINNAMKYMDEVDKITFKKWWKENKR